jgi:TetR/AcrR family transcriptional regulator
LAGLSRRESLLDAARTEFAANGYSGARIERIAVAAGANKQLIFHYFGSKDGLYAAVVSHMFSTAPTTGETAAAPPEAVKRQVAELAGWFARTPGAAVAITECASGQTLPEAAVATVASWRWRASAYLRSAIDDGQRQGHFRDDVDAQAVVDLTLGSIVGRSILDQNGAGGTRPLPGYASLLGQMIVEYCAWR